MNMLFVLFLMLTGLWSPPAEERWVVNNESQITIQGSTSIGSYSCSLDEVRGTDTLVYSPASDVYRFRPNRLALPVKEFECDNFLVDNDFQQLLQAKQHKNIFVEILELENPAGAEAKIKGKVKLNIIDKEKTYQVYFKTVKNNGRNLVLNGRVNLNFSDFDLVPPRRFGGLIKIDETIAVNFKLNIQKHTLM